jgi:hypothetical protein
LVTNLINVGQDGRFQAFANSTRRISPSVRTVRNHISAAFVFLNRYGEVPQAGQAPPLRPLEARGGQGGGLCMGVEGESDLGIFMQQPVSQTERRTAARSHLQIRQARHGALLEPR